MDSFTLPVPAGFGAQWAPTGMQGQIGKTIDIDWGGGDGEPAVITDVSVSADGQTLYVTVERASVHNALFAVRQRYADARNTLDAASATYGPLSPEATTAYHAFADAARALNAAEPDPAPGTLFLCRCGHAMALHDIYEPSDPRELCCVQGCDQNGCPGRENPINQETETESK
jgi:hypothetical protein